MAKDGVPAQSLPPAMWNAARLLEGGPRPVLNAGFLMSLGPPRPGGGSVLERGSSFQKSPRAGGNRGGERAPACVPDPAVWLGDDGDIS